jgi:hypothetical protein
MWILEFINTAMPASKIAYIRNEKYGLKRSSPSEESRPEKPPSEIKQFFHVLSENIDYEINNNYYQAKELNDISGHQPSEKKPVHASLAIGIKITHRPHPRLDFNLHFLMIYIIVKGPYKPY